MPPWRSCTGSGHSSALQSYSTTLVRGGGRRWFSEHGASTFYPMYVVRVSDFLAMREAKSHQVLKEQGLVAPYDAGQHGLAVFVSHQWCSLRHPDPTFHQLQVLQGLLRRIAAGTVEVDMDLASMVVWHQRPTVKKRDLHPLASGCVWYDYFAVPQPRTPVAGGSQHIDVKEDMGKAVLSIPAYVEMCHFFLVLVPPVPHADYPERTVDYHGWKQRGWCRLERIARALSPNQTHILLARSSTTLYEIGAQEYMLDAVGEGIFSVDEDRVRIAPVVQSLVENKLQSLLMQGDLNGYRFMLSSRAIVLRGLPGVSPHAVCASGFQVAEPLQATAEETLDCFLQLYGLRSINDWGGGKSEPIIFAARGGNVSVVEAMLHRRANVNSRERADDHRYCVLAGSTPLHNACTFRAPLAMFRLLLEHRADLHARTREGIVPLVHASFSGEQAIVATLLAARASTASRSIVGTSALDSAATMGRAAVCAQLIEARASVAPTREGMSPLVYAAVFASGAATIDALLAAPDADMNHPLRTKWFGPICMMAATLSVPRRLWGSRSAFAVLGYEAEGITPLMMAGLLGNLGEVRALVAAGADPFIRNARGHNAADLAEIAGRPHGNVAYLRDPRGADFYITADSLSTAKVPPPVPLVASKRRDLVLLGGVESVDPIPAGLQKIKAGVVALV